MDSAQKNQGVVIYQLSRARVIGGSVMATPLPVDDKPPGNAVSLYTNEDGIFDMPADATGSWTIEILHKTIRPFKVDWDLDGKRRVFKVTEINTSRRPGEIFFAGLIVALVMLSCTYLYMHYHIQQAGGPLSNIMIQKLKEANNRIRDVKNIDSHLSSQLDSAVSNKLIRKDTATWLLKSIKHNRLDSVNYFLHSIKANGAKQKLNLDTLRLDVNSLKNAKEKLLPQILDIDTSMVNLLKKNDDLMPYDKTVIMGHITVLKDSLATNSFTRVEEELAALLTLTREPPWPGFIPWRQDPWRYLEIIFWALAGVLVQKIISSGAYLWRGTFQNKGIWMQLSHLFTVPLLVLVTMMVLSMISFQFSPSDGKSIIIDIGEPNITRAFSFILAVAPWGVWDFVQDQARRLTTSSKEE